MNVFEDAYEVEPYRNAEIYRNYQLEALPSQIENHLDFMGISEDGLMLLGCSNLNGRFWNGSLWLFKSPDTELEVEKCITAMECESGVIDMQFFKKFQDKVIVSEDSGYIQILNVVELEDQSLQISRLGSVCEHDSSVLSLSLSNTNSYLISGGQDKCIKVWDLNLLVSDHTYRPAHAHNVTCVRSHLLSDSVFASCSLDGYCLLWDTRNSKPASVLLKPEFKEGLTALCWSNFKPEELYIGSESGEIIALDIRQTNVLTNKEVFNRSIHRMTFSNQKLNHLAVCADTTEVKIIDFTDYPNIIYSDDRHSDLVRGLTWSPQNCKLYSCGWDKKILTHIPSSSMEINGVTEDK